jgi:hypothetical protein
MKYEINFSALNDKQSRFLKDILERDKPRFEARLKEAVEAEAQAYLSTITTVVIEKFSAETGNNPEVVLTVTTSD